MCGGKPGHEARRLGNSPNGNSPSSHWYNTHTGRVYNYIIIPYTFLYFKISRCTLTLMKRVVEASLMVGPCQHDTCNSPCCRRCNSHENSNQHIWIYMIIQVYRSPKFKTKSTRSTKCLTSYDNLWKRTSSQIWSLLEISTPEFYDIKILPGTTISFQTAILYWEGQEMVHFTINCTVTSFTAWMFS